MMATQPADAPDACTSVTTDKFQVRHRFVGMMFALAMTEVARQGVHLFEPGVVWSWAPVGHLVFCIALIATSWVGWSNSIQNRGPLSDVFDLQFVDLLLDVVLVIIYFVIVAQVEIPKTAGTINAMPSARPEAIGLLVVFGVYIVWDVFTDVLRSQNKLSAFLVHVTASILCLLGSFACIWVSWHIARGASVIAVDVALIAIVFAFRALKRIEGHIARMLRWDKKRIKEAGLRFIRPGDRLALAVCIFGFLSGLIVSYIVEKQKTW